MFSTVWTARLCKYKLFWLLKTLLQKSQESSSSITFKILYNQLIWWKTYWQISTLISYKFWECHWWIFSCIWDIKCAWPSTTWIWIYRWIFCTARTFIFFKLPEFRPCYNQWWSLMDFFVMFLPQLNKRRERAWRKS